MSAIETDSGHVLAVAVINIGTVLDGDHLSGATTLTLGDCADLDDIYGGQVVIEGVTYAYSDVDDEASTITISPALVADQDDQTPVELLDPLTQLIATESIASVTLDGSDPGDDLQVPVRASLIEQLPGGVRGIVGESVTLQRDEHGTWELIDVIGRASTRSVQFWNTDSTVATADDTTVTLLLTHLPRSGSVTIQQNGVGLVADSEFSVDGQAVTIEPSANVTIRAGDVFASPIYAYDGIAAAIEQAAPLTLTLRDVSFTADGSAGNPGLPPLTEVGDLVVIAAMNGTLLSTSDTRFTKVTPGGSFGALYVGVATDLSPVVFTGTVQKMIMASFIGGATVLNADTINDSPYPASVPNMPSVAGSVAVGAVWQQTSVVAGIAPTIASPFTVAAFSNGTTNYHSMLSIYYWQDDSASATPASACAFSGAVDLAQATVVSLEGL